MIGIPNFLGFRGGSGIQLESFLLYMWGRNNLGQLGIGNKTQQLSPVKVGAANTWSTIQSGKNFSVASRTGGTLWSWGRDTYGQLGHGDATDKSEPVQIGGLTGWLKVALGGEHALALKTDGTLWAWGRNTRGQLGNGLTISQSSPVQVGSGSTGDWYYISCAEYSSFGIKTNGTLWAWGSQGNGVLGNGISTFSPGISSPIQIGTGTTGDWTGIKSGRDFCVATKLNGTLWAWGRNGEGQFGNGNNTNTSSPVQVFSDTNWNIGKIGLGAATLFRIKSDGSLWATGSYLYGQLGTGDLVNRSSPVQVGSFLDWVDIMPHDRFVKGIRSAGAGGTGATFGGLWVWGRNNYGQLGLGDTSLAVYPTQIGSGTTGSWNYVDCGAAASFVTRTVGVTGVAIWAWGLNDWGQLGVGDTTIRSSPVQVGSDIDWSSINASTYQHTAAIKGNGTLWTWGRNRYGALGLGNTTARSAPAQVGANTNWSKVRVAADFCTAIKTDGTLWSWGLNQNGQLGIGTAGVAASTSSPVQIGSGITGPWVTLDSGGYHTVAITDQGTMWAWGRNNRGQLGIGNTTNMSSPVQIGTGSTGPWVKVATGTLQTLALQSNGTLWAWGYNTYGTLGLGDTVERTSPVQVGANTDWSFVEVGVMSNATAALKTNNTLWMWGKGTSGQLGLGTLTSMSSPVQVTGGGNWLSVGIGRTHTVAVKTDGTLWGWGGKDQGKLASDPGSTKTSPTLVGNFVGWSVGRMPPSPHTSDFSGGIRGSVVPS